MKLSEDTLRNTLAVCAQNDLYHLRSLLVRQELTVDPTDCYFVRVVPGDPLFGYCPEESDQWKS